jgi:hypothetical protein
MGFWIPFWGAGISVESMDPHFFYLRSTLKLRWYNKNYVQTHFGGSIYSMTDPFYMLMLMHHLGPEFVVWDVAARIRFILPGYGRITADFQLIPADFEQIREKTKQRRPYIFRKKIEVKNEKNQVIAVVHKALYVRKRTV